MAERPGLSEAEREVIRALWEHGPATVRQTLGVLGDRGRVWAYTTVLTLLQRLLAKGYVASEPAPTGRLTFSGPPSAGTSCWSARLQDTANELCDGSTVPLVLALVQGNHFSAEDLARLRRLIDEAARQPGS